MNNFVIVTEPRTGFQWLSSLLNSHPDILCLGEIFNTKEDVRIDGIGKTFRHMKDEAAVEYIQELTKVCNKIWGFKLSYTYTQADSCDGLWDYILDQKWKIIHLTRSNLLDRYISFKIATTEQNWTDKAYSSKTSIFADELIVASSLSMTHQSQIRSEIKHNPVFEITYEQLRDRQVLEELQLFLGVKPLILISNISRQRNKPQSEMVVGYKELYKEFVNHPVYCKWFDGIPNL